MAINRSLPFYRFTTNSGWNISPTTAVALHGTGSDNKDGSAVPDFRTKIAQGRNACSDFDRTRRSVDFASPLSVRTRSEDYPERWFQTTTTNYGISMSSAYPDFDSDVLSRAKFAVLQKLVESREAIQGMAAVGELREVKNSVHSLASDLVVAILRPKQAMRRMVQQMSRRKAGRNRIKRAVSNYWLEAQFDILPLLSTICDTIDELHTRQLPTFRIRGWSEKSEDGPLVKGATYGHSQAVYHGYHSTTSTFRAKYTYALKASLDANDRFGFSAKSIPGAVWEWTPWSFLLDYAVGVGDWLSQMQYASTPFIWGCRSELARAVRKGQPRRHSVNSGWAVEHEILPSWQSSSMRYSRQNVTTWPCPMPRVKILDSLTNPFRVANVSALLASRINIP
jgi:hypothetical protein